MTQRQAYHRGEHIDTDVVLQMRFNIFVHLFKRVRRQAATNLGR